MSRQTNKETSNEQARCGHYYSWFGLFFGVSKLLMEIIDHNPVVKMVIDPKVEKFEQICKERVQK